MSRLVMYIYAYTPIRMYAYTHIHQPFARRNKYLFLSNRAFIRIEAYLRMQSLRRREQVYSAAGERCVCMYVCMYVCILVLYMYLGGYTTLGPPKPWGWARCAEAALLLWRLENHQTLEIFCRFIIPQGSLNQPQIMEISIRFVH